MFATQKALRPLVFAALLAATGPVAGPVHAADYVTTAPSVYRTVDTVCRETGVLGSIDRKFDYADRHFIDSGLDVVDFTNVSEVRYEPSDATHLIERHYCRANVVMTDSRPRTVWYVIEGTMGFAGIGRNVEYCISGLDPWHIYGANCLSVR